MAVGDYLYEHSTKLPKHITDHHVWGVENSERPGYMISPFQAQFQVWMAKTIGAKRSEFSCSILALVFVNAFFAWKLRGRRALHTDVVCLYSMLIPDNVNGRMLPAPIIHML